MNCKEIKLVHPKRNQPSIFIGRIDAEAPILWPPDVKSRFIRKDLGKGKDRRGEGDDREQDGWMAITDLMDICLSKPQETVKDGKAWCATVYGIARSQTRLSN